MIRGETGSAHMNCGFSPHIALSVPKEELKAFIYFYDISTNK